MAVKRKFSEEERIALLNEFEKLPPGMNKKVWLEKQGFTATPFFYHWRKKYLAAQKPSVKLAEPGGVVTAAGKHISAAGIEKIKEGQRRRWAKAKREGTGTRTRTREATGSFRAADEATKRRLVAEYDAIPRSEYKRRHDWVVAQGMQDTRADRAIIAYYRKQFRKKDQSTALVPASGASSEAALLAEYDAASQSPQGSKKRWLEQHGLSYSNIYEMRKRVAKGRAPARPAKIHELQPPPVAHAVHAPHILPESAPGPVVTLDDAVAAMQVRIDIYTEVLDHFRRMLRGGR